MEANMLRRHQASCQDLAVTKKHWHELMCACMHP